MVKLWKKKNLNCSRTLKKKQNPKHIKPKLNLYIIQVKLQVEPQI